MRGEFIIVDKFGVEQIIPNMIVQEGAEAYAARLFNASALTGFFVGLCNQAPTHATVLAGITTEPTIGVNGYARQALAQNGTDWPTITTVNEETYVESKQVTFTASGGAFDAAHSRLFLCSVSTGFVGTLYTFSAALQAADTLLDTESFAAKYRVYMN